MVASSTPGTTTSTGPLSTQLHSDGSTSEVGGRRNTPPLCASNRVVAGDRGSGANVEYVAVPIDRTTRVAKPLGKTVIAYQPIAEPTIPRVRSPIRRVRYQNAQRKEFVSRQGVTRVKLFNPATDLSTVKVNSDDRADRDLCREVVGYSVVECAIRP